ncbi:hydrocephalus-inducing protein-like [Cuculus canorus]|uniref:hydrocephalus-inducing protein-like n=1 Tax=Cuculus canorus TaxID=55661 RepID=UPI0023AAE80B|nr:hydrocephalus-inducing protein-like [Cuculus canorus]
MDVFRLDPPSIRLKPNEKQELSIWAYPTSTGLKEDNLICCIEDNPDPVVFRLCCQGVQVKLEVSPKKVQFNRLLLHRTDSKTVVLHKPTPLPVAWRIRGLEGLGEGFSVSQDAGIIGPCSEFGMRLCFEATKVDDIKKTFQVEVSDAEKLLGIVQVESCPSLCGGL